MSAELLSDVCRPDLAENVNHFLHGLSRRPETGVTCASACFCTQRARIRFVFVKGKIKTSNKHTCWSKTACTTAGANCKCSFMLKNSLTAICRRWHHYLHTEHKNYFVLEVVVKQSQYRPGQALRIPGGRGSQISRQSAHEGGKVVSPKHRPPLSPQEILSVLISVRGWVTLWSQYGRKDYVNIPVTQSGIEPATFRLVTQCLNQLHHRVLHRF